MLSESRPNSSKNPNYNCSYESDFSPESIQFEAQVFYFSPNQIPWDKHTLYMLIDSYWKSFDTDWRMEESPVGYVDAKEHGTHRTMKARNVPFTRQTLQLTEMILKIYVHR